MQKFSRVDFYQQNIIDGNIENDLAFNGFDNYVFKRPRTYYTVKEEDLYRPDLISLKALGNIQYWWVICKLNNLDDIYNDMFLGQSLQIPSLADVEQFALVTRRDVDL